MCFPRDGSRLTIIQASSILDVDSPLRDQLALQNPATVSPQNNNPIHARNDFVFAHMFLMESGSRGKLFSNSWNSLWTICLCIDNLLHIREECLNSPPAISYHSRKRINAIHCVAHTNTIGTVAIPIIISCSFGKVISGIVMIRVKPILPVDLYSPARSESKGAIVHIPRLKRARHVQALFSNLSYQGYKWSAQIVCDLLSVLVSNQTEF